MSLRRILLLSALATACGSGSQPVTTPPPVAPPPPAVPTLERAWLEPLPAGTPSLVVTSSAVTLGDETLLRLEAGRVAATDVRGGEHGYLVPAIQTALAARTGGGQSLALAIDPATPYRTVARVVYSAAQAGRARMLFIAVSGTKRGAVPVTLPTLDASSVARAAQQVDHAELEAALGSVEELLAQAGEARPHDSAPDTVPVPTAPVAADTAPLEPEGPLHALPMTDESLLALRLAVRAEGVAFILSGGPLEPGCERIRLRIEGRPAVARSERGLDWEAVSACLATIRRTFPDEDEAMVVAEDEIPFDEVLRTIAVVRGTEREPGLRDVALGVE